MSIDTLELKPHGSFIERSNPEARATGILCKVVNVIDSELGGPVSLSYLQAGIKDDVEVKDLFVDTLRALCELEESNCDFVLNADECHDDQTYSVLVSRASGNTLYMEQIAHIDNSGSQTIYGWQFWVDQPDYSPSIADLA